MFVLNNATAIRSYLGLKSIRNSNDPLHRMFYAIAALSMEGKTQSQNAQITLFRIIAIGIVRRRISSRNL